MGGVTYLADVENNHARLSPSQLLRRMAEEVECGHESAESCMVVFFSRDDDGTRVRTQRANFKSHDIVLALEIVKGQYLKEMLY